MDGISDIRIIGTDEKNPPRIRKEPYIDLRFRLNHKAPADWCRDFNDMLAKLAYSSRIKVEEGVYIESWVRQADEIVEHLDLLKKTLALCTKQYIEKIHLRDLASQGGVGALDESESEQGRLNRIIAGLDYND